MRLASCAQPILHVTAPAGVQGTTEVVICTDAALLRAAQADPLFSAYSALLLCDVAARSAATDLLLGLLRKARVT